MFLIRQFSNKFKSLIEEKRILNAFLLGILKATLMRVIQRPKNQFVKASRFPSNNYENPSKLGLDCWIVDTSKLHVISMPIVGTGVRLQ